MLEIQEILVIVMAMVLSSTVLSTLGFGLGLTASPVLLLVIAPQSVVVITNAVSIMVVSLILYQTRRHLSMRNLVPIAIAGLAGVPIGVYILTNIDTGLMRITMALLILLIAVIVASNLAPFIWLPRIAGPPIAFLVAGLIASSGIGGPLMALYLLRKDREVDHLRCSLAVFFLVVMGSSLVGYTASGLLTSERILMILVALGPAILGFRASSLFLKRMDHAVFRKTILAFIVVSSLLILVQEFLSI